MFEYISVQRHGSKQTNVIVLIPIVNADSNNNNVITD